MTGFEPLRPTTKMKGIKVEIVQAPYSNLFEQAANAGPDQVGAFDIILMDDPWIPFFAENGHLEDLTAYFKQAARPGPDNDFLSEVAGVLPQPLQRRPVCLPPLRRQRADVLL